MPPSQGNASPPLHLEGCGRSSYEASCCPASWSRSQQDIDRPKRAAQSRQPGHPARPHGCSTREALASRCRSALPRGPRLRCAGAFFTPPGSTGSGGAGRGRRGVSSVLVAAAAALVRRVLFSVPAESRATGLVSSCDDEAQLNVQGVWLTAHCSALLQLSDGRGGEIHVTAVCKSDEVNKDLQRRRADRRTGTRCISGLSAHGNI